MADTPSRQTIEALPGRLLSFLSGLSKYTAIRATLSASGYTAAKHQRGWELLHLITGFVHAPVASDINEDVRAAVEELDAWDEPNFRIVRACLNANHPAQAEYVFFQLQAETGVRAILSVKTFLDRLDGLDNGADRAATREADHAALATLTERGYTTAERARLRALVKRAESAENPEVPQGAIAPTTATTEWAASENEIAAYNFWSDWSETARVKLKRREQLIALGLASRQPRKEKEDGKKPPPANPTDGAPI